jgi:hypothetical protein
MAQTDTIVRLAESMVQQTRKVLQSARSEEDLRIGFEKLLEPALSSIGVETHPRYERMGSEARTVYRGRPDAVHGQVIVEYEPPGAFDSTRNVHHAYEQLIGYMTAQSESADVARTAGIGFDGHAIFFVRYQGRPGARLCKESFVRQGPYPFNADTARTLLTCMRALARLPLNAENLAARFGPRSEIAPLAVSAFADALANWGGERAQVFFREWQRLFGIVYGEKFGSRPDGEAQALASLYKVWPVPGFQPLLFSVHTYFALLMKLIAAELLLLRETAFGSSFSEQLTHGSSEELKARLLDMEDGGIYSKQGITNFLEGDFFRWYVECLPPRVEEAVREIARALSSFEPATSTISPESARDLLKKLYQYLVPQEVRHNLGEYYTPDWLAELVLNEVGYEGDARVRLLDPACGSGTFLVLAIQRAKAYALTHKESPLETTKRIAANIWGFDLNPLAVIAARTNYLFALGDWVHEVSSLEIPIYLADSVLWPRRGGQGQLNFEGGDHAVITTSVGEFHVPAIWITNPLLMNRAVPVVEQLVRQNYSVPEMMKRLGREGAVFPPHEGIVERFCARIVELAGQGRNGIWARFLKNAFAPLGAGRFDLVVGNPPWIRWGYLSQAYRDATLFMWKQYGLFSLKGSEARLGAGEKDFSMLFTYAAADYYLKPRGTLGFLITQEVFKSKGAGEGFRNFRLDEKKPLRVLKADDLTAVQPFEKAANKTALIVLRRGEETKYPVPYTVWKRKKGVGKIPTDASLQEALPLLTKTRLQASPIGKRTGAWQTFAKGQAELHAIEGHNRYVARLGARVEPYGVFWLTISQVMSNGDLLVANRADAGKRKIKQVEERIEPGLVFPAVRGADVRRWCAKPGIFILMSQNPQEKKPYDEAEMKRRWPRTYGYLTRFKDVLLSRGSKTVRQLAERTEFYAMFGIGPYTVAPYKVVWKRMASDLVAAVASQYKTPFGYKMVIPTDTTSFFSTDKEDVAHYLCAIINSTPVREFIRSYSSAGRGFGAPSVMSHVGIPEFDPKKRLHKDLAECSKRLHQLAQQENQEEMASLEARVDQLARSLFGLSKEKAKD